MQQIVTRWNLMDKIVETVVVAIHEYNGEHSDEHRMTDILDHLLDPNVRYLLLRYANGSCKTRSESFDKLTNKDLQKERTCSTDVLQPSSPPLQRGK